MTKKGTVIALAAVMFTASALGFSGVALADNTDTSWKESQNAIKNYIKHAPGVMGKVTAINGSTITVEGKNNTVYTVDASTAKILKNRNTVITIADIKVGDTIMAQGTVTGTNVVATTVFDGKPLMGKKHNGNFPGVMGIVSNVNGSTFQVTDKNNTIYTVTTTTDTKIKKGNPPVAATITDILNGDAVMVRGAVNGSTVSAESIFDGKLGTHRGKGFLRGNHKGKITQ